MIKTYHVMKALNIIQYITIELDYCVALRRIRMVAVPKRGLLLKNHRLLQQTIFAKEHFGIEGGGLAYKGLPGRYDRATVNCRA